MTDEENTPENPQNKTPLTDKQIKALKSRGHVFRIADYPRTGLRIVVTEAGYKKWAFAYTAPLTKKRQIWTFANYPATSLADARVLALGYRQDIKNKIDPRHIAREEQAEQDRQNALGSVSDLFELYIKDMEQDGKPSVSEVKSKFKKYIAPRIGNMPVNDVSLNVAVGMLANIGNDASPYIQKRCRSYCLTAWKLGLNLKGNIRWHKYPIVFELDNNPFMLVEPPKNTEKVCDRYLTKSEVIKFWHEPLDMHPQLHLVIKFLIFTGQRVIETLHATWSEFDLDSKIWTIPAERRKTRNTVKTAHTIPLTDEHLSLLKKIKMHSGKSKYLFPNESDINKARSKDVLNKAIRVYCKEWKSPFYAKSTRKTFKTLSAEYLSLSKDVRDRLQGHSVNDVSSRHYDRYSYLKEKREAMKQWSDWLIEITKDKT